MRKVIIAIMLALPFLLLSVTRTVSLDGTQQYTSIQTAINACGDGDFVLVYPGEYFENIECSVSITLASLEFTTNDTTYVSQTIINGNADGTCVSYWSGSQTLRGFTITNGGEASDGSSEGGGIFAYETSSLSVINCDIVNNKSTYRSGIETSSGMVLISGTKIHHNYSQMTGGGVRIFDATSVVFDPVNLCSVYENYSNSPTDILIANVQSDVTITLDMFTVMNPTSYFAYFGHFTNPEETYTLTVIPQRAYLTEVNSNLYVSANGSDNNSGLTPQAPLKNAAVAMHRIASDASSPKEVILLSHSYSINNQDMFPIAIKSYTTLKSTTGNSVIFCPEFAPVSASYQTNATIDGIIFYPSQQDSIESAIRASDSYGLTLRNSEVTGFNVHFFAPIYLQRCDDFLMENTYIHDIQGDGVALLFPAYWINGTLRNCRFENLINPYSDMQGGTNNTIGFVIKDYLNIENCVFKDITRVLNDGEAAISIIQSDYSTECIINIVNNLFINIHGPQYDGDAIEMLAKYPLESLSTNIINNTFANITSDRFAVVGTGHFYYYNNIFSNSTPYDIGVADFTNNGIAPELYMDSNCIYGGIGRVLYDANTDFTWLDNNIDADPLFQGNDWASSLSYQLISNSPCIDAGTDDTLGLNLPFADLIGNYRIWNNRIDMGCYEYGAPPVTNDDPELPIPGNGIQLSLYPNPVYATGSKESYSFIEFTLPKKAKEPPVVEIYNLKGQRVRSLTISQSYNDMVLKAGLSKEVNTGWEFYSTVFDCKDLNSRPLATGIYLIRVKADGRQKTAKLTILR